jgi:ubiquinone/menaquinone biosynthesis C-methylase UbiE
MYKPLLRFGFRRLYNEFAFTYDAVSWIVSRGEWHTWQRTVFRHLDIPSGTPVLELAHGTANLQRDLYQAGYDAIGIDLSQAMGHIASHKLRRTGIDPHLIRGDVRHLPFSNSCFPAVISTFPTEFITEPAVIAETYRILAPGGQVIIVLSGVIVGKRAADTARLHPSVDSLPWSAAISKISQPFAAVGFKLTSYTEPCTISLTQLLVASKSI